MKEFNLNNLTVRMKNHNLFLLCIISLLLYACDPPILYDMLSRQRLHNSPQVIYDYSYTGGWVGSSFEYGKFILDSTENCANARRKNKIPANICITNVDLPENKIEGFELVSSDEGEFKKNGIYTRSIGGVEFIITQYKKSSRFNYSVTFSFMDIFENNDSIFFYKPIIPGFNYRFPDMMGYRKGDFAVEEDSLGNLVNLYLIMLAKEPWIRWMYSLDPQKDTNIYVDGKSYIDLPPFSEVYVCYATFIPNDTSRVYKISDYGVFKPLEVKR